MLPTQICFLLVRVFGIPTVRKVRDGWGTPWLLLAGKSRSCLSQNTWEGWDKTWFLTEIKVPTSRKGDETWGIPLILIFVRRTLALLAGRTNASAPTHG